VSDLRDFLIECWPIWAVPLFVAGLAYVLAQSAEADEAPCKRACAPEVFRTKTDSGRSCVCGGRVVVLP
jgi:hypothetical protein